jgi:hypothetical protein
MPMKTHVEPDEDFDGNPPGFRGLPEGKPVEAQRPLRRGYRVRRGTDEQGKETDAADSRERPAPPLNWPPTSVVASRPPDCASPKPPMPNSSCGIGGSATAFAATSSARSGPQYGEEIVSTLSRQLSADYGAGISSGVVFRQLNKGGRALAAHQRGPRVERRSRVWNAARQSRILRRTTYAVMPHAGLPVDPIWRASRNGRPSNADGDSAGQICCVASRNDPP